MPPEDDAALAESAQENADFASGFSDKPNEKAAKPAKPEQAAPEKATAETEAAPEHVQITRKEWEEVRAAAARTASYETQLSRLHGTTGKLQTRIAELQKEASATPTATRKFEVPKAAFEDMAKDFPELAEKNRAALEAVLSGLKLDGNDVDEGKIEKVMAGFIAKKDMEALEDTYPDWRTIVGAVDVTKEQPDQNNAYRRWLGTKDPEYQRRINETESAAVIQRSITLFRRETRTPPKPAAPTDKPRDARADRIRAAVQPKGDGAPPTPGKSEDDEFLAGFNSR